MSAPASRSRLVSYSRPVKSLPGPRRPYVWLDVRGPSGETWPVCGLVDSGADYSALPMELAALFGHRTEELRRRDVRGVNGTVVGFSAAAPLKATVHGLPRDDFELDPIYVSGLRSALLGRRDFFIRWTITFAEARQAVLLQVAA